MSDQGMGTIGDNVARVQERLARAAIRSGRDPGSVTLVAVAKTFPAAAVCAAYDAGIRHFGENRVEEGMEKMPVVKSALVGPAPIWHMVGHVQSRKARDVVTTFDYVHSVDRPRIAYRLSRFAEEANRIVPILLECNVSGEESKFGFDVAERRQDQASRDAFYEAVEEILRLPCLSVQGLMTMAPLALDPEAVRPVFAGLRELLLALSVRFPEGDWRHLSMGMTDDFEVAVEEGATMVRIGRAIFAGRQG